MKQLAIHNPASGALITQVDADDAASVATKTMAARAAQPGWLATPLAQRKACISRFRAAVVNELEVLAATMSMETGKPIRMSRNELNGLLGRIDFFLKEVDAMLVSETVFAEGGMTELIAHMPLGVVANISAWNYPWFVGGNVFIPALLTGNSVLYKPSEYATLTGLAMAQLLHDAGVPKDVFTAVIGAGAVGAALLAQKIDGLFFTGSHSTGTKIAQAIGPRLVKLQLELGGKDPTYVCDDADPKAAAESLADGAMYNTGQSCCSVERIYVHAKIYDAFVAAFVATVRGFTVGDPMLDDTYIGAMTRPAQLDVLDAQVADAKARGATLLLGGHRLPGPGNWYAPTVFTNVNHNMELMREESFGPIIGIQKVAGDAEALQLMNDTRYGLTAGVYSPDEDRAKSLLAQVNAGSVYWNCCDRVSPRLPWSGHGDSGVGLTLSTYGIQNLHAAQSLAFAPALKACIKRRMKLTLFDLDHTLLDGDSDALWCEFLIAQGVLERDSFAPRNADIQARYRDGTVGPQEFANFYVGTLAGRTRAEWQPLRQQFLASAVVPRIGQAALDLVRRHQDAGDLVVLTTATNRFLTELTAIYFDIEHLIATEPQMQGECFTGATSGTLNMREGKVTRLHDWLHAIGYKLNKFDSSAYSDSINDLPLLQAVQHPVAVNPDAQLRAQAVARGWPILQLGR